MKGENIDIKIVYKREKMKLNELGIVVLNYNNYFLTIKAVNNILFLDKHKEIKIVIVDNNSNNDSLKKLNEAFGKIKEVKIIKNLKNLGYAAGNNIGMKYLCAKEKIKYIGVMNPDVIIPNIKVLGASLEILKKEDDIAIISPTMIINDFLDLDLISWKIPKNLDDLIFFIKKNRYRKYKIMDLREELFYTEVDALPGSFFIIKKDTLIKINFFDENTFLYCEERILAKKIKIMGKKSGLLLNQYFYHEHGKESTKFNSKIYMDSLIYYNNTYNGNIGKIVAFILKIYRVMYSLKYFLRSLR